MFLEARAQMVESVLKIWFYNSSNERVPMWNKDGESVLKLLGQEKLGKLTDALMELRSTELTDKQEDLSPETLEVLTQKANELLQEIAKE